MFRHHVGAVVPHIGYLDAAFPGGVQIDVVHAHAVADDDLAVVQAFHEFTGKLGFPGHDGIGVPGGGDGFLQVVPGDGVGDLSVEGGEDPLFIFVIRIIGIDDCNFL